MPKSKPKHELRRITEYMISGGAYFWTGYAVFFVCDQIIGLNLWWAKLAANVIGWVVNYMLQRYWVFRNPALAQHQTEVTGRYIFITLVDFMLDYLIVWGLTLVGISPYIGTFIASGFFTVWNYLWYKFWVFPEKMTKKPAKRKIRPIAHRPQGPIAYKKA